MLEMRCEPSIQAAGGRKQPGGFGIGIGESGHFRRSRVGSSRPCGRERWAGEGPKAAAAHANNGFISMDKRPRGWRLGRGMASFHVICAVGALANVDVVNYAVLHERSSWMAGLTMAAQCSIWDYAVSSVYTWRRK